MPSIREHSSVSSEPPAPHEVVSNELQLLAQEADPLGEASRQAAPLDINRHQPEAWRYNGPHACAKCAWMQKLAAPLATLLSRNHVYAVQCVKTFKFFEEQRLTLMSSLRSSSSPREEMSMSGSLAVETTLGADANSSESPAKRDALLAAHDKMADMLYSLAFSTG